MNSICIPRDTADVEMQETKPMNTTASKQISETEEVPIEDVGFLQIIYWLLWKNVKVYILRNKRSWCCKMLLLSGTTPHIFCFSSIFYKQ